MTGNLPTLPFSNNPVVKDFHDLKPANQSRISDRLFKTLSHRRPEIDQDPTFLVIFLRYPEHKTSGTWSTFSHAPTGRAAAVECIMDYFWNAMPCDADLSEWRHMADLSNCVVVDVRPNTPARLHAARRLLVRPEVEVSYATA